MDENVANRRRHKRFPLGSEAAWAYLVEPRERYLAQERCPLQNLSHTGMCIRTPHSLPRGRDYFFWLEFDEPRLQSAAVKGAVRWVEERGDRGYDVGVSFTLTGRGWLTPYNPFQSPQPDTSLP